MAVLAAITAAAIAIPAPRIALAADMPHNLKLMEAFGDAYEKIRTYYVSEVDDETLIRAAIKGMVDALDPHSAYLTPEMLASLRVRSQGAFGGLGIEVTLDESGMIRVIAPVDGSPASTAGLQSGDLISVLDGRNVIGMTLDEAVNVMRGKIGAAITLTIIRDHMPPFDVVVIRENIVIAPVHAQIFGQVGYVRISQFNAHTMEGLETEINLLQILLGDTVNGYILDLRNNPGGTLPAAIAISDAFLERGEIVSIKGRNLNDITRSQATPGDLLDGKPLVVLIDRGSASASEIVAGALKDHRRAVLVGQRSFGKGSVQTISALVHQEGGLKITTQFYYTPSGTSIQARGIEPDITISPSATTYAETSDTFGEIDLPGAIANTIAGGSPDLPSPGSFAQNLSLEAQLMLGQDPQLKQAFDVVNAMAIFQHTPSPS